MEESVVDLLEDDDIPASESYRGIRIHDWQPTARIRNIVRPAIDAVLAEDDLESLAAIAMDISNPPEARLLAAAKLEAAFNRAAEEHRERPNIDVAYIKSCAVIANSRHWRDPDRYASLLCLGLGGIDAVPREIAYD
jgi:hypothetical protein